MRHTTDKNDGALQDVTIISIHNKQQRHLLSSPADPTDLYFYIAPPHAEKSTVGTTISSSILSDNDVFVTPPSSSTSGRKVAFATPLVTQVHEIPRLTRDEVRMLFYTREEQQFFKRLVRMMKMIEDTYDGGDNSSDTENIDNFLATSPKVPKGLKVITTIPYNDVIYSDCQR